MARILLGSFLLAHGAVHLLYLAPIPEDDGAWPFLAERSWLIPDAVRRPIALATAVAIVAVYLLAALAIWIPGMRPALPAILLLGSALSLLLFAAYWHPWLSIGVVIAVALAALTLTGPTWWERIVS